MQPVVVVGAAIVRDGRALASRRTSPASLAGRFEFAGGKVEPGESEQQALHRELAEELGVGVEVTDRLGTDLPLSATAVLRVYLCRLIEGQPALRDHDEHRWLGADELFDVPWIEADLPLVSALQDHLRGLPG